MVVKLSQQQHLARARAPMGLCAWCQALWRACSLRLVSSASRPLQSTVALAAWSSLSTRSPKTEHHDARSSVEGFGPSCAAHSMQSRREAVRLESLHGQECSSCPSGCLVPLRYGGRERTAGPRCWSGHHPRRTR